MVEWFRAFKNQDYSKRDYRKFFKPVLCYLEGGWTRPKDNRGNIDEPFESDRHSIDAKSWFELQEKVCFSFLKILDSQCSHLNISTVLR